MSVADFVNHAKFVFSWLAWVVYRFAIATKGSKPHSHQQLLADSSPGGGKRRRRHSTNFRLQIFKYWPKIVM